MRVCEVFDKSIEADLFIATCSKSEPVWLSAPIRDVSNIHKHDVASNSSVSSLRPNIMQSYFLGSDRLTYSGVTSR